MFRTVGSREAGRAGTGCEREAELLSSRLQPERTLSHLAALCAWGWGEPLEHDKRSLQRQLQGQQRGSVPLIQNTSGETQKRANQRSCAEMVPERNGHSLNRSWCKGYHRHPAPCRGLWDLGRSRILGSRSPCIAV